jgi:hypothetical protein
VRSLHVKLSGLELADIKLLPSKKDQERSSNPKYRSRKPDRVPDEFFSTFIDASIVPTLNYETIYPDIDSMSLRLMCPECEDWLLLPEVLFEKHVSSCRRESPTKRLKLE